MDPTKVGDAIVNLAQAEGEGAFLLARLVTAHLRDEPLDTSLPQWETRLARTVEEAFQRDISRIEPLVRNGATVPQAAPELLEALAWAYGAGFPDDLWPLAATALSRTGFTYEREDVYWILGQAERYIIETGEGDRAAYRLSHQRLAQSLRPAGGLVTDFGLAGNRASVLADRLTEYYLTLLAAGEQFEKPTYLWRYLWRHCADAGQPGIETLRRLISRNRRVFLPDLAMALGGLARIYLNLGRFEEAAVPPNRQSRRTGNWSRKIQSTVSTWPSLCRISQACTSIEGSRRRPWGRLRKQSAC